MPAGNFHGHSRVARDQLCALLRNTMEARRPFLYLRTNRSDPQSEVLVRIPDDQYEETLANLPDAYDNPNYNHLEWPSLVKVKSPSRKKLKIYGKLTSNTPALERTKHGKRSTRCIPRPRSLNRTSSDPACFSREDDWQGNQKQIIPLHSYLVVPFGYAP